MSGNESSLHEGTIDLKARFGDTYRIEVEEGAGRTCDPAYFIIPCRHGHFYPHGGEMLGFATNNRGGIAKRLASLPFVTVAQDGADGMNLIFSVEYFEEVAEIVKPKRRRQYTEEQKEAALANLGDKRRFAPKVTEEIDHSALESPPTGSDDAEHSEEVSGDFSGLEADFAA